MLPIWSNLSNYPLWIALNQTAQSPFMPSTYITTDGSGTSWDPSIWTWSIEQYQTSNTYEPGDLDALKPGVSLPSLEIGQSAQAGGPAGTITTDRPPFNWAAVPGTSHYILTVIDTTAPKKPKTAVKVSKLSSPIYSLAQNQTLTPGHSYTWTAEAVSGHGQTTTVVNNLAFMVANLGIAVLQSPTGPIATDRPTFTWAAVPNAGHYALRITDSGTGKTVVVIGNVTGTSVTLSSGQALTPGRSYSWSVMAVSTNGDASSQSNGATFSVDPLSAPTPIGPSGSTPTLRPTFTWDPVTDAGHYYLEIIDSAGHVVVRMPKIAGTSYKLHDNLKKGHTYTWKIAAVSTNGKVMSWSTLVAVTAT
jgi:hypothetical protein